jgi:hypothetical protein
MSVVAQHGYLLIADISGYTSYLAGVELDHAHEILTDLLEVIVGKIKSLLTIAKLEGDAVFAYALESKVTRGETLLELIESTYAVFHDRITSSRRHTTCQCRACQNMPSLDLKFFIHHGDYIVQDVMGIHELVGSDVNLIHRLLKNHVTENTGWKAYALLTERALEHIGLRPTNMHKQTEAYEHLGETKTYSYDLKKRYRETVQSRRVVVAPEEAIVTLSKDIPAPVTVLWDWLNDPRKRAQYTAQKGLEFRPIHLPNGRRGVGAQTHCMHGQNAAMKEVVLDWKPFDYYTVDQAGGPMFGDMICTFRLEPLQKGNVTRLTLHMKGTILPGLLNKPLMKLVYGRLFMPMMLNNLAARILEEQTASSEIISDEDSPQPLASHSGQA